jgi:hypothetical protein
LHESFVHHRPDLTIDQEQHEELLGQMNTEMQDKYRMNQSALTSDSDRLNY